MTHFSQLAYRFLKQQKKRSLLTIAGIILSMALVFSSTSMGEALKDSLIENVKLEQGNYHVAYTGVTERQIKQLQEHVKVAETAVRRAVGVHTVREGLTIAVTGGAQEYLNVMSLEVDEGSLPQRDGEIALERWVIDNMSGGLKLGDKVRLKLAPSPSEQGQLKQEQQEQLQEVEFVLAAIFKSKVATQQNGTGIGIVSLDYAGKLRSMGDGTDSDGTRYDAAILIKKPFKLRPTIDEITAAIGADAKQTLPNTALLTALGEGSKSSDNTALLVAQGIVIGIILITTVAVIYNAFHISVLERIRQFGLLRSIGMTPRQIRRMVFREAAILGGIGIPLGMLGGYAAIKILMAIFTWMDGGAFIGSLKVTIHWYVPAATVLLGAATIWVSAFGPAYAAGRVSPLDAVLNRNPFNKEKTIRHKPSLPARLLGFTGRMAFDNMKRNRKRYRITLFSMTIGIILYVFFTSFLYVIQQANDSGFLKDMALISAPGSRQENGLTLADYEEINAHPDVKLVYRSMRDWRFVLTQPEHYTEPYKKQLKPGIPLSKFGAQLYGYRPDDLELVRSSLVEGNLDYAAMDAGNGVLIMQNIKNNKGRTLQVTGYKIGDTLTLIRQDDKGKELEPIQVKVMGILDSNPYSISTTPEYSVLTTEHVFTKLTGLSGFDKFDLVLRDKADPYSVKELLKKISERNEGVQLQDYTRNDGKIVMLQISILLYGLVTVISIISGINIIHTISTNLILRTREFGTLRAVGMSMKQMRRMIVVESIWYGIMATLYGGSIGTVLAYWFYTNINKVQEVPYRFPLVEFLSAGFVSALICLMASRVPLMRIERMDIVDAIRAEE